MNPSGTPRRVAVIGGGCSGLAAAFRVRELAPETRVVVFEASERVGGVIRTERCGEYLIENGADMFTTKEPWAYDLCRRLGLDGELIDTNSRHARAFVIHRGRSASRPRRIRIDDTGEGLADHQDTAVELGWQTANGLRVFRPAAHGRDG